MRFLETQAGGSGFHSFLDTYDEETLTLHQNHYDKCYEYQNETLAFPLQHDGRQ
jgi:hypothetical protein